MNNLKKVWLSYPINKSVPLYGGRTENFNLYKTSSIKNGNTANDTRIETTVHMGTHIDMPYHFHDNGQTIENFDIDFWFFKKPLFLEFKPENFIIKDDLINLLDDVEDQDYDILIIKTGMCCFRNEEKYWKYNYGFHPDIYTFIKEKYKKIRVMGFDSISISSWQDRNLGKISHQVFLNPSSPLLILEDMDLNYLNNNSEIKDITVLPLRIENCDGLPCTIYGTIYEQ